MNFYMIRDIITGELVNINPNMILYYTYTDDIVHIVFNDRESITVSHGDWNRLQLHAKIIDVNITDNYRYL